MATRVDDRKVSTVVSGGWSWRRAAGAPGSASPRRARLLHLVSKQGFFSKTRREVDPDAVCETTPQ